MQQDQILNSGENFDVSEGLCPEFSINAILAATNDFSDSLVIGQGGFAKVYKGEIDNGTRTVAIKKSKSMSPELRKEFRNEILMVSKFRHSHLVSLIGYCETDNEMILVYEYMASGTLDENLHKIGRDGNNNNVPLCWIERLKIGIGVARGLDYLHTGSSINNKVIHRDIKSSNILLDQNRTIAKIADFGMSKIGPANQEDTRVMTRVIGTFGYLDPEYFKTCFLTSKSDVYAFGVVLFELLCGRRAVDMTLDQDQRSLAEWARLCVKKGKVELIIDPNFKSEMMPRSLSAFVKIASRCLNECPNKRPTMMEVLNELAFALSLQETRKQNGSTMTEKLLEFFSVKPRPISGNVAADCAAEAAPTDENDKLVEENNFHLIAPIQLDELKKITNNFSKDFLIGGCYSQVCYGTLGCGASAAIKKLYLDWSISDQEFLAQGRKGFYAAEPGPVLSWSQRVKIAVGAAKGLLYLHEKGHIHQAGLKSTNVLLFDNDVAKIADIDFDANGDSEFFNQARMWDKLYRVNGTLLKLYAHRAPEYVTTGQSSSKSDVYSFGVVLLELLAGRKMVDDTLPRGSLLSLAVPRLSKEVKQFVDRRLYGKCPPGAIDKMAALAAACLQYKAKFRQNMDSVVKSLQSLR